MRPAAHHLRRALKGSQGDHHEVPRGEIEALIGQAAGACDHLLGPDATASTRVERPLPQRRMGIC
ncbi:MAG: hypothetical protein AAGA68_24675 [Pseudomonadota bacterium]